MARVLQPGGEFVASTLGPNTLKELRWAWQQVDDYQHVNEFIAEDVLQPNRILDYHSQCLFQRTSGPTGPWWTQTVDVEPTHQNPYLVAVQFCIC